MQRSDHFIITGAIVLAISAFLSKLIGAIYRLPLTNILGAEGIGLYQMVFPVYTLLLDFSGAGVPSALSKIISGYRGIDRENFALKTLKSSLKFFIILGLIGSILMAALSFPLSLLQGNKRAYISYLTLSPSVLFVSVISCFRGYFQGLKKMTPTAVSQIIEQLIKLVFGLFFARLFLPEIPLSSAGATLGVSLSEIAALSFLYLVYKKSVKNKGLSLKTVEDNRGEIKTILKTVVPVTVTSLAVPLIHLSESFLIINLLGRYTENATGLYGLFSGAAHTLICLPVSVCYGFAVVAIPAVSGASGDKSSNKNAKRTLLITLVTALIASVAVYFACPFAVKLLFKRFSEEEAKITVKLVKILSVNVMLLSFLQTANAVLIAKGRAYAPLAGLSVGLVVDVILNLILLKTPHIGIYGSAISSIACYFCAGLINLILIIKLKVQNADKRRKDWQYSNG